MRDGVTYIVDNRPLDEWGRPIGKRYEDKQWEELSLEEMMADFDWKNDILATYGKEIDGDTFYQDYLFYELYAGKLDGNYKVLLTEYDAQENSKCHKVNVEDICDYMHLSDVALSPCLFYSNWRKKKLLNYVSAFVLDIDKLRPGNLQRFFMLFDTGRLLRPTFISNSGSGVHFYYLLDKMLRCDPEYREANSLIATEIYGKLYDDVIVKEKWTDAQRHWLGQDYRVVNSRTKLNQVSRIFQVGDVYTIEELTEHYQIKIDSKKRYATKAMIKYATNIAKDLGLELPDFENSKETYDFIRIHKDAAYLVREKKRQERKQVQKKRKSVTWYKNTLAYMQDHTHLGYRFSSMKALAIIAYKEKVPREVFIKDLNELANHWSHYDWNGDDFNGRNVEAIIRLFDGAMRYSNTSSETLEEWLGYEFKRIGVKRNGRKQAQHLQYARGMKRLKKEMGEIVREGRPKGSGTKQQIVVEWKRKNVDGTKADCIKETGLSKPTVYKYWNGRE